MNKKTLYILIPAVAIIWGMIIYKIVTGVSGPDRVFVVNSVQEENKVEKFLPDTFNLINNYPDPFLKQVRQKVKKENNIKKDDQPRTRSLRNRENTFKRGRRWPDINYGGIIENKKNNTNVCLININNQDYLMNENDVINEVKLINYYEDSIIVEFNEQTKTINKSGENGVFDAPQSVNRRR
jgi:hypothetical protein